MIASAQPDKLTKRWMRDASDELAVYNGCWFDERRGQFVVDWLRDYLVLYEGECAGQPFECKDWQYEFVMRLFGWVYESEEWARTIRRFRKSITFIAKKNKKSPTLAAVCIYTAFGDGEMGQKCFPTAKNGNQIRENVGRHIHEMIAQSGELASECKLNKNTMSVFHEPTRSLIMPLSSENAQSQKALEGLNGSIFVDEVHVVDKAHMNRISRAGISRAEPLHVEVSTAGNDPDSYGMGRFKYAEGVIGGEHKDWRTLAMIYAAPQDLSDAELLADPAKYARMANPAMGHTVKESELLHDLETSKHSVAALAECKMYRFDIWQHATNPWLNIYDWNACPAKPSRWDADETTFAGLDLSRTTDFTAFVQFQNESEPRCKGHYWCPRKRAIELSHQFEIPVLDWERDGWVTLCDGPVIDRDEIHDYLETVRDEQPQLKHVGFDPYNADDTVKFCTEELDWEMVEVRQGRPTLNGPSKRLEELVLEHGINHCGDPVLAWMLRNTSVSYDDNGNMKPVKTVGGVRKHIDGIVGLIMAILMAMSQDEGPSVYETPGMLAL